MKLTNFSFKKILYYLSKFEKADNKLEAVHYLIELLLLLKKKGGNDERTENFLNKIQEEMKFQLGTTSLEDIKLNIYDLISETKNRDIMENITKAFDRYENMFGQTVPMNILP
jgi:hypothetical protein